MHRQIAETYSMVGSDDGDYGEGEEEEEEEEGRKRRNRQGLHVCILDTVRDMGPSYNGSLNTSEIFKIINTFTDFGRIHLLN